jgi:hypothetical protein
MYDITMDIITSTLVFALLTSYYITIYSHEVTDVAGLTSFSFGIEEIFQLYCYIMARTS